MKANCAFVGFVEKAEIVREIDRAAEALGVNRSGFCRQIIRQKLATNSQKQSRHHANHT